MFVFCVHPVALLNAAFCVVGGLWRMQEVTILIEGWPLLY